MIFTYLCSIFLIVLVLHCIAVCLSIKCFPESKPNVINFISLCKTYPNLTASVSPHEATIREHEVSRKRDFGCSQISEVNVKHSGCCSLYRSLRIHSASSFERKLIFSLNVQLPEWFPFESILFHQQSHF